MKIWFFEEGKIDVNIWVNLDDNSLAIQIVERLPIFLNNKFTVFVDKWGAQYIQKEGEGKNKKYKFIEIFNGKRTEVEISEEEAVRIIRDVMKERIEERLQNW
jgi:hypothetical protein